MASMQLTSLSRASQGWTRSRVPLDLWYLEPLLDLLIVGAELMHPGMTFHFPISEVLEQKIYRNVTRKSEKSQLELLVLVCSSASCGRLLKFCACWMVLKQNSSLLH